MIFNDHSDLEGCHAFLSASKYHWINYDVEKLSDSYKKWMATQRGTELHEFAKECIRLGQKLQGRKTLSMYVNDAIGFRMTPEQVLFYSVNAFGTADAICFRKNTLRIHDLKTGETPTHMEQLRVYTALFCLEYDHKPSEIETELRIYQNNQIFVENPDPEEIEYIMNQIVIFDTEIDKIRSL